MIEELLAHLHLEGDAELEIIAQNYFLEVVASKVINNRSIESKVACSVYITAKKKGYELSYEHLIKHIAMDSVQGLKTATALCE